MHARSARRVSARRVLLHPHTRGSLPRGRVCAACQPGVAAGPCWRREPAAHGLVHGRGRARAARECGSDQRCNQGASPAASTSGGRSPGGSGSSRSRVDCSRRSARSGSARDVPSPASWRGSTTPTTGTGRSRRCARRRHELRDTYASQLLTAGVQLGFISTQLGHAADAYRAPLTLGAGEVPADLLGRLAKSPQSPHIGATA